MAVVDDVAPSDHYILHVGGGLEDRVPQTRFDQLFLERTGRGSMIITSNRDTAEWLAMFDDVLLAQSAVDRFKNAAYDFVMEGESYRPRLKPKLDAEGPPERGERDHHREHDRLADLGGGERPEVDRLRRVEHAVEGIARRRRCDLEPVEDGASPVVADDHLDPRPRLARSEQEGSRVVQGRQVPEKHARHPEGRRGRLARSAGAAPGPPWHPANWRHAVSTILTAPNLPINAPIGRPVQLNKRRAAGERPHVTDAPLAAGAFIAGGIAMIGAPPLVSFPGHFFVDLIAYSVSGFAGSVLVAAALLVLIAQLRAGIRLFAGSPEGWHVEPKPVAGILGVIILVALLAGGIAPDAFLRPIAGFADEFLKALRPL